MNPNIQGAIMVQNGARQKTIGSNGDFGNNHLYTLRGDSVMVIKTHMLTLKLPREIEHRVLGA